MQKAMNFNDAAIVTVKGNGYWIHFLYMGKDEAINLLKNAGLTEKFIITHKNGSRSYIASWYWNFLILLV